MVNTTYLALAMTMICGIAAAPVRREGVIASSSTAIQSSSVILAASESASRCEDDDVDCRLEEADVLGIFGNPEIEPSSGASVNSGSAIVPSSGASIDASSEAQASDDDEDDDDEDEDFEDLIGRI
eukprot:Clim_evm11s38 gene=Clim_evmTU11s38